MHYNNILNICSAHDCTVRGVSCDGLNQKIITGDANGLLCFWRFKAKTLLDKLQMDTYISQMLLHRDRLVDYTTPLQ